MVLVVRDPDALPEDTLPPGLVPYAERFADEGVPLRAMARAFKQTTDAVRAAVEEAIYKGRIVEIPKDDWPVGQPRSERSPSFVRTHRVDDEKLVSACQRLFKVTRLQGSLLAILINRNEVNKETMHQIIESRRAPGKDETDIKMVDVVICNLRKRLKPFNLGVTTLWGSGYAMLPAQRRQILEMVNRNAKSEESPTGQVKTESKADGDQPNHQ